MNNFIKFLEIGAAISATGALMCLLLLLVRLYIEIGANKP